jgi:DnaJ-class molecular chaperone
MKRISDSKKVFNVDGAIELAEIKKTYRSLVKEWHPDKFQAGDEKAIEAEEKSRQIIEAYHFLVSIAPETKAANLSEYNAMLAESSVADFQHERQVLEVTFKNGTTYEYFGVSKKLFEQLNSSPTPFRFAKRKVFSSFLYRRAKKDKVVSED